MFVTPHQFLAGTLKQLKGHVKSDVIAVSLIKGLDVGTKGPVLLSSMIKSELSLTNDVVVVVRHEWEADYLLCYPIVTTRHFPLSTSYHPHHPHHHHHNTYLNFTDGCQCSCRSGRGSICWDYCGNYTFHILSHLFNAPTHNTVYDTHTTPSNHPPHTPLSHTPPFTHSRTINHSPFQCRPVKI